MNGDRVKRVLCGMRELGVTDFLLMDPLSILYLTGQDVRPMERFFALCLRGGGRPILFANRLFGLKEDPDLEVVLHSDGDPVMALVTERLHRGNVGKLGVDKGMPARFLLPLLERWAPEDLIVASPAVDLARGVKDAEERERMAASSRVNDQAMGRFKGLVHEGVTEAEVARQLMDIYLELGAQGFSFSPLVAFGANAADPHHAPDGTVLKEGDCVLFDVGCRKDGYCSDMTRTFFWRSASEHHRQVYETVRRAQETAEAGVRPGVRLCDIDALARDVITAAGYGPNFTHRLGHFIGLETHEYGDVSPADCRLTEPGMIFSIEPGIYLKDDIGVRIEDLVLVTEEGCERLNRYSKELEVLQ